MRNPSNERVFKLSRLTETMQTRKTDRMKPPLNLARFSVLAAAMMLIPGLSIPAVAQPTPAVPAGRTILTFVNRLLINPPQVLVFGYFPTIEGLPGPLFSGAPGENSAYFTWSLNAAGAVQLQNGDANAAGSTGVAVLPSDRDFNVYYNASPNQNWNNPASFSTGELVATFRSETGTQTGSGPVALVTQSYVLVSSRSFSFKGQSYDFVRLIPHGFTVCTLSSNVPLGGATTFPLIFTASGSAVALGGGLSALPWR